jgi:hypothetical protein
MDGNFGPAGRDFPRSRYKPLAKFDLAHFMGTGTATLDFAFRLVIIVLPASQKTAIGECRNAPEAHQLSRSDSSPQLATVRLPPASRSE